MRQWIESLLVQIMACRLFGAKPLLNQWWIIVNWTLRNNFKWNFIKLQNFLFAKMHLKILSAKWRPFCPRGRWVKGSTYKHPQFQTYCSSHLHHQKYSRKEMSPKRRFSISKPSRQSGALCGYLLLGQQHVRDGATAISCVAYKVYMISIAWCAIAVTPVSTQWGKHSVLLSHRYLFRSMLIGDNAFYHFH